MPTPAQAAQLAGGVYQVQRTAAAASFIELPLMDLSRVGPVCAVCR